MAYYLNLFSPETYETFSRSDRTVSGFRYRQRNAAAKVQPGDRLICYMTKLSRWIGVLDVLSPAYEDETPLFYEEDDPFIIRFTVKPLVWLSTEKTVPIREDHVWNSLSFTRGQEKHSSHWTGKVRVSLGQLTQRDGQFLEKLLFAQAENDQIYPIDDQDYAKYLTHTVRRVDKVVSVSVPQDTDAPEVAPTTQPLAETRESIKIQALLATIGAKMGMRIWLPRSDRGSVMSEWAGGTAHLLDVLPLNYDETTLKTVEQIDVLWLRGRAIVRAFEVEHTTSIYSGILRMADLLALQPNMDIKLHIVAPYERRDKVFQEVRRPVFSLLEKGPLSDSCTFLSYGSVRQLAKEKHLTHLSDSVLDDYAEEAE
jgi:predicted RNA-binding protein